MMIEGYGIEAESANDTPGARETAKKGDIL
jgi:hypothetical protein